MRNDLTEILIHIVGSFIAALMLVTVLRYLT